jgi:hypothetical protein
MASIKHPVQPEQDKPLAENKAPLVRATVIAKALDVSPRCVHLWAQNGVIPCRRIGGIVRFSLSEIMEVMK